MLQHPGTATNLKLSHPIHQLHDAEPKHHGKVKAAAHISRPEATHLLLLGSVLLKRGPVSDRAESVTEVRR